jgi:superfamily II DNA or RNA helicase
MRGVDGIRLWPFQSEAIQSIQTDFAKGIRRAIVSMPTGTGKTVVIAAMVRIAIASGRRCLIIVPSGELVIQTIKTLGDFGVPAGVVKRDRDEWDAPVVIAQMQTLSRRNRLARIPWDHFSLVLIDECHMSYAPTHRRVMRYMCASWFVGFTATPFRGDKRSLALAGWQSVSFVYPLQRAIQEGYLAQPVPVRITTNTSLVKVEVEKKRHGDEIVNDFRTTSLEQAVNTQERNSLIVRGYLGYGRGERAVAFCVTRRHALDLANAFRAHGISAAMVHFEMPQHQREAVLRAHQAGEIWIVTNVAVLTQGYDDPTLGCIILARPTLSKVLHLQCLGRGLRSVDGRKKQCIVLDVVDACGKHKLAITDEVLDLKRDMQDPTLGVVTAKERNLLLAQLVGRGLDPHLSERVAFSDSLGRTHLAAYLQALGAGRFGQTELCQVLGLVGGNG